jgi:hypothetical protein
MRPYLISWQVTDQRHGWKLGTRVLPHRYVVRIDRYVLCDSHSGQLIRELTETEVTEWSSRPESAQEFFEPDNPDSGLYSRFTWLELEVASTPTHPPLVVALRAPGGISARELRFPFTGIVTEATARLASTTGSWELGSLDWPTGDAYEDNLFEAKRARGRKRTREPITDERLAAAARVAREHPRTPTAAVQRHFRISRGYARRLLKLAEAAGLETFGR